MFAPQTFFLIFQLVWNHFALYFSHWSDFPKYRIVSCSDVLLESSYLGDEIMSSDALQFAQLETCCRWGIRYVWFNIVMKSDWVQLRAFLAPPLFMAQPGDTQSYNWKCPLHFSRVTKEQKVSRFWGVSEFFLPLHIYATQKLRAVCYPYRWRLETRVIVCARCHRKSGVLLFSYFEILRVGLDAAWTVRPLSIFLQ